MPSFMMTRKPRPDVRRWPGDSGADLQQTEREYKRPPSARSIEKWPPFCERQRALARVVTVLPFVIARGDCLPVALAAPLHYGLIVLGALAGAGSSGRRVLRPIVTGRGAYGPALFGLPLYACSLAAFMVIVLSAGPALMEEARVGEAPEQDFPALPVDRGDHSDTAPAHQHEVVLQNYQFG